MRIVLDTNVLVSGLLSGGGPPGWILEAVLAGRLDIAFDARIRAEYDDVLSRREFRFSPERIAAVLAVIDAFGLRASAVQPWPSRLPDPADDPFLAVAGATGSVLVTGHTRHFPVAARGGVIVRTPREFIEDLRRAGPADPGRL